MSNVKTGAVESRVFLEEICILNSGGLIRLPEFDMAILTSIHAFTFVTF